MLHNKHEAFALILFASKILRVGKNLYDNLQACILILLGIDRFHNFVR